MADQLDQIPNLKVNKTLAIPSGETSERPQELSGIHETNLRWNKTLNDFDIYSEGEWKPYTDVISFDKKALDKSFDNLKEKDKTVFLGQLSALEYMAEQNRMKGQSGIMSARQYNFNAIESYMGSTSVSYSPLSGHVHWNFRDLIGMAEWAGMANGYYFRTRHNDYNMRKAAKKGSDYLAVEEIQHPKTPKDVLAQKTPALQMAKAREYFKVLQGEANQNTVADYKGAFQWVMTYCEVFLEVIKPTGELADTFGSGRHQIDADGVLEVIKKNNYFSYGGHKNTLENIPFIGVAVGDVDEDTGIPDIVLIRHRLCCAPVGSLKDYPVDSIMSYYGDATTARRFNKNQDELINTRQARFRINASKGNDKDYAYTGKTLIDTFMEKIPGLDGAGAVLRETYINGGKEERITKFGSTKPLNAAYYNRYYSMDKDASGRRNSKRGFNDDKLWVAKTTRPQILQREFGSKSYGFSYAFPLEMFIDSFLDDWNPHNAINGDSLKLNRNRYYNSTYGNTKGKPLPGYFEKGLYHHTPAEFYTGGLDNSDVADTGRSVKWIKCKDGQARRHYASGFPYFLPGIEGVNKPVRIRFPIYYAHEEGSFEFKQIEALRADFNEHLGQIAAKEFQKQLEIYNYDNK